jgi:transposase-like protein
MEIKTMGEPKSLQEAILYFSNPDNCLNYLVARRWPKGVVCPTCGSDKVSFSASRRIWQCSTHHPKRQFSVKVGTIFEDSPIGLDKWLAATWMLTNCKNGISSYEVARALAVTQKSAWFMLHRIRLALQDEAFGKVSGEVEVDETFIGGAARNMHAAKRRRVITARGFRDKVPVVGILERGGRVHANVIPNRKKKALHKEINAHVAAGSAIYTDALMSYMGLDKHFVHQVVDHAEKYVDGKIHTNGLENFWSLVKRGLKGTYISVEPFHLFRYLDEQAFRYNNRELANDGERFSNVISRIMGKRLTWDKLTGKVPNLETCPN